MKLYLAYSSSYHEVMVENQCRVVVSYAHHVGKIPQLPPDFTDILIDSGGYQLAVGTATRPLYFKAYTHWLHSLIKKDKERIKGYFVLDTGDPEETFENYLYMQGWGLSPMPIWKDGWPTHLLDLFCRDDPVVGIAARPAAGRQPTSYYRNLFKKVQERYPGTAFHMLGLGVTAANAFGAVRPYSIDCSSWLCTAKYGSRIVFNGVEMREKPLPGAMKQAVKENEDLMLSITEENIRKLKLLEVYDE